MVHGFIQKELSMKLGVYNMDDIKEAMKRLIDKYKPHIKEIYSYTYEEDLKRGIQPKGLESFEAMTWNYAQPHAPSSAELAKELNVMPLKIF